MSFPYALFRTPALLIPVNVNGTQPIGHCQRRRRVAIGLIDRDDKSLDKHQWVTKIRVCSQQNMHPIVNKVCKHRKCAVQQELFHVNSHSGMHKLQISVNANSPSSDIEWCYCVFIGNVLAWIHYNIVIIGALASQIPSLTIVYSTVYSGADQRKRQCSASLAFVRGIHRWPVNSPHKRPVTRKMFLFDDVIIVGIIKILSFKVIQAGPVILWSSLIRHSISHITPQWQRQNIDYIWTWTSHISLSRVICGVALMSY